MYDATAKHIETGIELKAYSNSEENGGKFVFRDLWPGDWRLSLSLDERELWSQMVVVHGSEAIDLPVSWSEPGALELRSDIHAPNHGQ